MGVWCVWAGILFSKTTIEQWHNSIIFFFEKKKNLIKKKFENIFQNFYKSIHFINININTKLLNSAMAD